MLRAKLRSIAVAALFTLAAPALAVAQHDDEHHPAGKPPPPPHGAPPHPPGPPPGSPHPAFKPVTPPHGPVGGPPHPPGPPPAAFVHPGGPPGPRFTFHGHEIERIHREPFIYPPGWGYRRWAVGGLLPPIFLVRDYWYPEWAALGLPPPPPGAQWVRYGPDLLLVDVTTGQVIDVAYDVFY